MTNGASWGRETMALSCKGAHVPTEVMLMGVRWGVALDHATINRWVIKDSPQLEEEFHRRKRQVWVSWHMAET